LIVVYALGVGTDLFASDLSVGARLALFGLGVTTSALLYYRQFYRPTIRIEKQYQEIVLDHIFRALVDTYRQQRPGDYDLRASVMRVSRPLGRGKPILSFAFWFGEFTAAEFEQSYAVGVGNAGNALARNEQAIYDAVAAHENRAGMTATQQEVTAHVASILSTPVYRPGDADKRTPIAVLNLDSRNGVVETGFREDSPRALADTMPR